LDLVVNPSTPAPQHIRRKIVVALTVVAVAVTAGVFAVVATRPGGAVTRPAPVAASVRPATPFDHATRVLQDQAAALLRGDLDGWLAAVDPARRDLVTRYRAMFTNLRGMRITYAEYLTHPGDPTRTGGVVEIQASLGYCVSAAECPPPGRPGRPFLRQVLDMVPVNGRLAITAGEDVDGNISAPAPWDRAELQFAYGDRVIVAAAPGQAAHLPRVLQAAEKAATIADRYAAGLSNPQERYRVFLADKQAWARWYGGAAPDRYAYTMPLQQIGTDVILNAAALDEDADLQGIVNYQFGQVVTLDGRYLSRPDNAWLVEGMARYIRADAQPARRTPSAIDIATAVRDGRKPATVALPEPGSDATSTEWGVFEGLGHFAVDCLADTYGEEKLLTFVTRVLREAHPQDEAAREVFGQSFAETDRACARWTYRELEKIAISR
jgi:hypothetical protein